MTEFLASAAAALVAVYALGWVPGSLLLEDRETVSWSVIRLISGLLLSTLTFLLSLVLSWPWFAGPAALLLATLALRRRAAVALPQPSVRVRADGAVAAVLATILVAPILISTVRMAPGDFAPVFFSVDNAYVMEKVQALTTTQIYPPESLSNLGGRRSYHFATQGMGALLARISGLAPHNTMFGIVVPLMTAGVVAAAVAASRAIAPALPLTLTVPLLLISVPTFWYPFWGDVITRMQEASTPGLAGRLAAATENFEMWGVVSTEPHNIAGQFVVLASVAGIFSAAVRGWRLPIFLIGSAVMVKTSVGVALLAGFLLSQAYRVVTEKSLTPAVPAAGAAAVFAATYGVFWMLPALPSDFSTELFPFFHVGRVAERDGLAGLMMDLAWLFVPLLVIATVPPAAEEGRGRRAPTLPLLVFGLAPLLVVNVTRAVDQRAGGGGATDDWLQILLSMTFVLHAFVLAFASRRWGQAGRAPRAAFALLVALTVLPVVGVAARYSQVVIRTPERGHEFVDNRELGRVLRMIPVNGSLIVTNDLRYPAQNFGRENRQMQIPALFGHQAFAVNYAYEAYDFSAERRELQRLLQSEVWTPAIDDAARQYGWTHLLIRKDYVHPRPIPLEIVFETADYAIYRFPPLTVSP